MTLDHEAYAQAKTVFQKALALNPEQRKILLDQECAGRPAIRAEVESLLQYHEGGPTPQPAPAYPTLNIAFESTGSGSIQKGFRRLVHKKSVRFALLVGLMLMLAIAAKFGRDKLHHVLKTEISGHLSSVLNSNFLAINLWSGHRFDEVERWATVLQSSPWIKDLLAISRNSQNLREDLMGAASQTELRKTLEIGMRSGPFVHFVFLDDNYRVISSDLTSSIGHKLEPDADLILLQERVLKGGKIFTPRRLLGSGLDDKGLMKKQEYVSWFGVPVREASGRVIGILSFAVEATRSFDQIVSVGRWGVSGETYAFNNRGFMVSESRFIDQLVAAGLLLPGQTSGLNLALKDPGGSITEGFRPEPPLDEWPLTRIASRALSNLRQPSEDKQGQILEPYRDYRGVDVIGAWRWHPSLHFGLISEVNADEALLTLRFIDLLYMILITLFIMVAVLAAQAYFTLLRIRPAARIGSRMGQYRLLRKIAEGGIGEIFLARHEFLKRPTAIKILKSDSSDPGSLRRFEDEVRATSQLTHPNTVAIYDFGRTVNDCFYYAMEYLPGISLARLIEMETRLPCHRSIHLLLQICGSLKEAHALGLIHRDIKPLNIMVCRIGGEYDVIKVVDFGLVKSIKSLMPSESTDRLSKQLRGTPAYMAPELLIQPLAANVRSDIYSLGVVAYKMLSGHNLFDSTHEAALLYDILHTTPRPLAQLRPDLPDAVARLVMRCIDKNPLARPASVEELSLQLTIESDPRSWSPQDAKQWWMMRDHLLMVAE